MPRSRNIKPGFFTNDRLCELPPLARILFAGLWCLADREGRLEDRPKRIKAEVLPYDNFDVDKLLNQLAEAKFILRYEVAGVQYIQVANFTKHQNPHKKEAASIIPPPGTSTGNSGTRTGNSETDPGNSGTSPADSGFLIPDSLNLIPDSNSQDKPDKKQPKVKYADNVSMTEEEHAKLVEEYGEDVPSLITILDNYKGASGKTYKSDYKAILSWVVKRLAEDRAKAKPGKPQPAPSPWDDPRLLTMHIQK